MLDLTPLSPNIDRLIAIAAYLDGYSERTGYGVDSNSAPTLLKYVEGAPMPTIAQLQAAWVQWQQEHPSAPEPAPAYNAILAPGTAAFSLFQRVRAVAKRDTAVQLAYVDFQGALQADVYNSAALSGALANLHADLSAATPATLGVTLNATLRAELMQGNSNAGFTTAEKNTIAAWAIAYHLGVTLPWA